MLVALAFPLASENLIIYGDDSYAPLVSLENGKPVGILVDILRRVEQKTGDTYQIQLFPWKRALELALAGKGGLLGTSWNKERSLVFDYSAKIYDDDIQLVMLKGKEFPFRNLADLNGKVVGGVIGASYGNAVDSALEKGLFTVERDVSQTARLKKLLTGRIEVALIGNGKAGFERLLASDPYLKSEAARFVVAKTPVAVDPLFLVFLKTQNKRAALERFNAAWAKLAP